MLYYYGYSERKEKRGYPLLRMKKRKYKSELEEQIHKQIGTDWEYEQHKYPYSIPKTYTPDFTNKKDTNNTVWIEVKGYFQDYNEVMKYLALKNDYPLKKIVFIFSNPKKKVYAQARRRTDGSFMSLGEWSDKHGFTYYSAKDVLNGKIKF